MPRRQRRGDIGGPFEENPRKADAQERAVQPVDLPADGALVVTDAGPGRDQAIAQPSRRFGRDVRGIELGEQPAEQPRVLRGIEDAAELFGRQIPELLRIAEYTHEQPKVECNVEARHPSLQLAVTRASRASTSSRSLYSSL
jgi:hypothetical protein